MQITLERGDITRCRVDAIVNAANTGMLGGGGVDGAIHRAAGPDLVEACRRFPKRHGMRCPPGEARITPGFRLPAPWVIHTVGPIYRQDPDPAATLRRAHLSSLALATEKGLRSVAFPAISCGVYGYPLHEAAPIAISAALEGGQELEEVRFVLFDEETLRVWEQALASLS